MKYRVQLDIIRYFYTFQSSYNTTVEYRVSTCEWHFKPQCLVLKRFLLELTETLQQRPQPSDWLMVCGDWNVVPDPEHAFDAQGGGSIAAAEESVWPVSPGDHPCEGV